MFSHIRVFIFLSLVFTAGLAYSQEKAAKELDYKDFKLVEHQDVDDTPLGPYSYDEFTEDWGEMTWNSGVYKGDVTLIVDYDKGGRKGRGFEWNFPANSFSLTQEHGYRWDWLIDRDNPEAHYDEIYLSYSIMFRPNFHTVKGGKIPGLRADPKDKGPPEWTDGFGGTLMFKPGRGNGYVRPVFYLYHHDMEITVGETFYWDYTFNATVENWYDITYRVVLNTATATDENGPDGLKDGIVEGYVNGVLVGQVTGLRMRNLAELDLTLSRVTGFFGGSTDSWATERNEWILLDNFYMWTYSDEYLEDNPGVKRGNQANTMGDTIYTPFDVLFGNIPDPPDPPDPEIDSEAPSIPGNLTQVSAELNSVSLTWDAATDNVGVTTYKIHMNGSPKDAAAGTSYTVTGLDPSTTYDFQVSAGDAAGNESPKSPIMPASTTDLDTDPPGAPASLILSEVTGYSMLADWPAAVDNVGVDHYEVYVNGNLHSTTDKSYKVLEDLEPNVSYTVYVRAVDAEGNTGPPSPEQSATTIGPDEIEPTEPQNLRQTAVTETTIDVVWDASTDNVAVKEYIVYVNNLEWDRYRQTHALLEGLLSGLEYVIAVSAVDDARNESPRSDPIEVTTKSTDIITKPKLPEIAITQVQDNTITPRSTAEMTSLGFTDLRSYGLEIREKDAPERESLVLLAQDDSQVLSKGRVQDGLQVFYNFSEGEGNYVMDRSGLSPAIDLYIHRAGLATDWLTGQGLQVYEPTIIEQEDFGGRLLDSLRATEEISLEVWVRQTQVDQDGDANILTISSDETYRAATLIHKGNQAAYNYAARLNTSEDQNGNLLAGTSQDFTNTTLHHVIYTRNTAGAETIFVNGQKLAEDFRPGGFELWDNDYKLAMVNEITGGASWQGILYLAAVYNKALTDVEVQNNYLAGFGQIEFISALDTLSSNVIYELTPFITTDQGLVLGESREFLYQDVTQTDTLLTFYPNPNNGTFTVAVKNQDENLQKVTLRIADFSGQIHYIEHLDLSEGLVENYFEIQLPDYLESGLYSVILLGGYQTVAGKLVLMRH